MSADVVIFDPGSSSFKAGFSGEDLPRVSLPSVFQEGPGLQVDRQRKVEACDWAPEGLENNDGVHPIQRGSIADFDAFEKLMEQVFRQLCRPEDGGLPVLITESPLTAKENREKLAQLMFEKFKVSGLCIANSAVLSLFCSGRTRGVTVEVGGGVTHAVPIFEGFALPHATVRLDVAGQDVTHALKKRLEERGHVVPFDIARQMKEAHSMVTSGKLAGKAADALAVDYELPDGTIMRLDGDVRSAADVLFQPSLLGEGRGPFLDGGVANITTRCIEMCDRDLQPDLLRNVTMAGPITMVPGFSERMKKELLQSFPTVPGGVASILKITPDPANREPGSHWQRKHAAWIGGSMFASLDTFKQVMVTTAEWEDNHENIVHRKCL